MKKTLLSAAFIFAAFIGANAQTVISQTGGVAPTDSTVACAVGQTMGISESSYFRAYTMTTDFSIQSVRVGVGSISNTSGTGNFPVTVKLHLSNGAFPGSYPAGLTELATATAEFSEDQELTLVDVNFDSAVSVSSGNVIVVEVHNINTSVAEGGNGSQHYMGIATTETAPAYLVAAGCGINSPTSFAGIGFPEGRLILDLVESTASVKDNAIASFTVYPNPANDVINVSNAVNAIEKVVITDMNGRVVKSVVLGVNEAQINISDLSKGVYFLQATSNGASVTEKIVKK